MKIDPKKVAWKDMGGEVVVVDLETNAQYVFNGTARDVWMTLADDGTATQEAISARIRSNYEDVPDDDTLRADVSRLLDEMQEKQLICCDG